MPRRGGKGKATVKAKVKRKHVKAGSKNIGGDGGICVAKVLKIREAMKSK